MRNISVFVAFVAFVAFPAVIVKLDEVGGGDGGERQGAIAGYDTLISIDIICG